MKKLLNEVRHIKNKGYFYNTQCSLDLYFQPSRIKKAAFPFLLVALFGYDTLMIKSNLGREGFVLPYTSLSQLIIEEIQARSSRQQPEGCTWSWEDGRTHPFGLLPTACSVCFLSKPRTTYPGLGTTHSGLGPFTSIHHQENTPVDLSAV